MASSRGRNALDYGVEFDGQAPALEQALENMKAVKDALSETSFTSPSRRMRRTGTPCGRERAN